MPGFEGCYEDTNPGRSAFMLNVGTNWAISEYWGAGAFCTLNARSGATNQAGTFSVRYAF